MNGNRRDTASTVGEESSTPSKVDLERYLEIRRAKILEGMPYPIATDYAYGVVYGTEEY